MTNPFSLTTLLSALSRFKAFGGEIRRVAISKIRIFPEQSLKPIERKSKEEDIDLAGVSRMMFLGTQIVSSKMSALYIYLFYLKLHCLICQPLVINSK